MPEFYSERGFAQHARDIPTGYGETVSVYETSSAEGSYVWLKIEGEVFLTGEPFTVPGGETKAKAWGAAHCDLEAAKRIWRAMGEWIYGVEGFDPNDPMSEVRAVTYDRSNRGREALRLRVAAAESALTGLGWWLEHDISQWPPTYEWKPGDDDPWHAERERIEAAWKERVQRAQDERDEVRRERDELRQQLAAAREILPG